MNHIMSRYLTNVSHSEYDRNLSIMDIENFVEKFNNLDIEEIWDLYNRITGFRKVFTEKYFKYRDALDGIELGFDAIMDRKGNVGFCSNIVVSFKEYDEDLEKIEKEFYDELNFVWISDEFDEVAGSVAVASMFIIEDEKTNTFNDECVKKFFDDNSSGEFIVSHFINYINDCIEDEMFFLTDEDEFETYMEDDECEIDYEDDEKDKEDE